MTLITLIIVVYGVLSTRGYGRALALGGATPAGAALVLNEDLAVPTFYTVALGTVAAIALQLLGRGPAPPAVRRRLPPGVSLLLLFLGWSALVTLVSPMLFEGLTVLTPGGQRSALVAGVITGTNSAQLIYLMLAVCIVVFLARSPKAGPELIGLAAGLTVMLSLWRYSHEIGGVPFPEDLFDNSPAFAYIETAPGGVDRFRGILSEPAGLAVSCLVALVYMLPRAFQVRGWHRAGAIVVAVAAAYLGVISTSATFIVAGVLVAAIAALAFLFGFLIQRTPVGELASIVACLMVIAALWALPIIAAYVELTVNEKVSSSSFDDRSGSDSVAYEIFLDTFGFGAGLGASRASSFFPGLLSATGVVGTLLFAAAVVTLIRRSAPVREYRPVIWALVTVLVVKIVSGPDLNDSSGILWMSLGLLSHAALVAEVRRASSSGSTRVAPAPAPASDRIVKP